MAPRPFVRLLFAAVVLVLVGVRPSDAQAIAGDWLGTLKAGALELRVVVHIAAGSNGSYTGTMDSPDQGAKGIPLTTIALNGSSLTFAVAPVGGSYAGTVDAGLTTIDGTWVQAGASLPLRLGRVTDLAALEARRPQTPSRPYPYREENVAYANAGAAITLGGTLTLPQGQGPFPAVVLITGSGAQDRDETLLGHKPFLVLADHLTRRGIAVLRVDDRGVGQSTGTFATATSQDFAGDVEAGIAFLQARREIDGRRIGLVGHSEGGLIAPMVAARNNAVAFIVMMAGSGVPGDEILVAQSALIAQSGGVPPEVAQRSSDALRDVLALLKRERDDAVLAGQLRERLGSVMPPAQVGAQVQQLLSPWYRYFISYDPAPTLRRVRCPVLAIGGEKDLQVPPKQNLPAIRAALEAGGNTRAQVQELPGLNHLFQTATTGSPTEYARIEETMSPVALDLISSWILRQ